MRHICKTYCLKWNKQKLSSTFRRPYITSLSNQLTLKCTARSAWMHCKEKEQKNQPAGKVHDPAFKITEIYFQENYYVTFWWKWKWLIFKAWFWKCQCTISSKYSWSNEEVFDAKRISYSELGFASRILHHKFMLHGLWCNVLMSHWN